MDDGAGVICNQIKVKNDSQVINEFQQRKKYGQSVKNDNSCEFLAKDDRKAKYNGKDGLENGDKKAFRQSFSQRAKANVQKN